MEMFIKREQNIKFFNAIEDLDKLFKELLSTHINYTRLKKTCHFLFCGYAKFPVLHFQRCSFISNKIRMRLDTCSVYTSMRIVYAENELRIFNDFSFSDSRKFKRFKQMSGIYLKDKLLL